MEIMPEPRNHNHIIYRDVRVPLDHLLGPEDGAKVLAQRRLGGGRIHHAMRTIAQCNLAFDMMCERALSRESHGKIIGEHQMVQEKIAESYAAIKMLRLFVLETAWKIDNTSTQEARTEIAAVKFTMAKVLREVSFNALHILGSLGTTDLTPIQAMYASAPTMGIADGVDEVHKATVARRVLGGYRPHEGNFPTEFLPYKREAAQEEDAARARGAPGTGDGGRGIPEVPRPSSLSTQTRQPDRSLRSQGGEQLLALRVVLGVGDCAAGVNPVELLQALGDRGCRRLAADVVVPCRAHAAGSVAAVDYPEAQQQHEETNSTERKPEEDPSTGQAVLAQKNETHDEGQREQSGYRADGDGDDLVVAHWCVPLFGTPPVAARGHSRPSASDYRSQVGRVKPLHARGAAVPGRR